MFAVTGSYTSYSIVRTEVMMYNGLLSFSSVTDRIYTRIWNNSCWM